MLNLGTRFGLGFIDAQVGLVVIQELDTRHGLVLADGKPVVVVRGVQVVLPSLLESAIVGMAAETELLHADGRCDTLTQVVSDLYMCVTIQDCFVPQRGVLRASRWRPMRVELPRQQLCVLVCRPICAHHRLLDVSRVCCLDTHATRRSSEIFSHGEARNSTQVEESS